LPIFMVFSWRRSRSTPRRSWSGYRCGPPWL